MPYCKYCGKKVTLQSILNHVKNICKYINKDDLDKDFCMNCCEFYSDSIELHKTKCIAIYNPVECKYCKMIISRSNDMDRHLKTESCLRERNKNPFIIKKDDFILAKPCAVKRPVDQSIFNK
jgi:hypothetical protein